MLRIAADLELPLDAVTETFLIFGKKGSGKTATAGVFAEELITAGLPVAVLDPMGAWWGLRASADGKGPGLPVAIAGGEHADLPIDHGSGAAMADLVVEERIPVVIDLFLMSKTQQRQFVTDFMERLFHRNREPVHLIIDEADRWAPQRGTHDMARLLGAYEDIVLRGRRLGIGSTSITLRVAQLHSAIRSQVEVLIAMRMLGVLDVAAIDEWIRLHASETDARDLKASLPSLPVGTAWVWSPGWLELLQKVQIRPRRTFDSSATPKVGQQRIVPRTLADVDISALQARMAAVIEKAEQDDPKALRKRVADLERQLATGTPQSAVESAVRAYRADIDRLRARVAELEAREPQQVPVITDGQFDELRRAVTMMRNTADQVAQALLKSPAVSPGMNQWQKARQDITGTTWADDLSRASLSAAEEKSPSPPAPPAPTRASMQPVTPGQSVKLGKRERSILTVLAQYPAGRTPHQIALLTGYSPRASTIGAGLSTLRKHGYVSASGSPVLITDAGVEALGDYEILPTGPSLLDYWNGQLGARERALLAVLLEQYPQAVTHAVMAEKTGYSPDASTIGAGMSKLRGLGLADGWAAAADFVDAIHA